MRIVVICLAAMVAVPVAAQTSDALFPGSRVRVLFASDDLPLAGAVYTGVLEAVGDTLVMRADSGPRLRFQPGDLAGLDISAGRRPYPYWLVPLGAAAGAGGGYLLGDALFEEVFVPVNGFLGRRERPLEFYMVIVAGATLGSVAAAYVGTRVSSERWVPAGRVGVGGSGVSWRLDL